MPMEYVLCEIRDLHHEDCYQLLSTKLNGWQTNNSLQFDNNLLRGEIIRNSADKGLAIAKWKCLPHQSIHIRKTAAGVDEDRQFLLMYFLNPATFYINNIKKFQIRGSRNNIFLSNEFSVEFHLFPKQPFYLFEVSFTPAWLIEQLRDADHAIKEILDEYISKNKQTILTEPFTLEEYKILHELEVCMLLEKAEDFFIRSRVYNLVIGYFTKIINKSDRAVIQTAVQYDQLIEAEMLVMENIKTPPSVETVARKVNMSAPSLIRKFKVIHGKSLHEYYVSKKMELARKMIIELGISIKQLAHVMGYNQPSAFIESFTKQYGYTPGQLKHLSKRFCFF